MTAIVAGTGSGKSSVLNMIPVFDVTGGRVSIDGVDVGDIPLQTLRPHRLAAGQRAVYCDIASNIKFADENMPDERMRQLASRRLRTITAKNRAIPSPSRAVPTSGGQKQRLSIARAIAAQPRYCCLTTAFRRWIIGRIATCGNSCARICAMAVIVVAQRIANTLCRLTASLCKNGTITAMGT